MLSFIFSVTTSSNFIFSVSIGKALLSMFVRFGDLGNAWYVFGKMEERDVFSWNVHVLRFGFESDVDVVNALITMYVKCGDVQSARLVFALVLLKLFF